MDITDKIVSAVSVLGVLAMAWCAQLSEPPAKQEVKPVVKTFESSIPVMSGVTKTSTMMSIQKPEYPAASLVWNTLRKNGYSEAVTAGILGNMMTECGGCGFSLHYDIYDSSGYYYGICQWNKGAYAAVHGQSLEFQIQFLLDTIQSRFRSNYESFLNSSTPEQAALKFAIWYEGCAEWSYPARQSSARRAFEYFGGDGCDIRTEIKECS